MKKKAIWISYDFGLKGDFSGLFTWLDDHQAVECGNGLAFLKYKDVDERTGGNVDAIIKAITLDLKKSVKLAKSDRVYIIIRDSHTNKVRGEFVSGDRKQAPWEGYGKLKNGTTKDIDE